MKVDKKDNFLELVPKRKKNQEFIVSSDGLVKIIIPRDGIVDRFVRFFIKTPKKMEIELDEIGSTVWIAVDGKNSIGDVGNILLDKFGDKIEPLHKRLAEYIVILRNNKFIYLEKI
ncbi:PqqD family protein [Helicovermis profundi]|uniref:PqqD family peptide modification chaperone n=1 Tax=Helicovermis profundi TaxID=3065157 RepID=A0AAU9EK81_9FIRM|nr:PqqD family peptide modification chaperone [Clostridia bacterium S502]